LRAVEDGAPVDAKQILATLKSMKDQQAAQTKSNRTKFMQEAAAAASNSARAMELWEEAVRATQFQGVPKENAQFREWKDKEGDCLKEKEVASALHLYFNWLSLTLQRSAGADNKTLLPAVLAHARELVNDQALMDTFDETLRREKEAMQRDKDAHRPSSTREKEKRRDGDVVKKLHDQILNKSLSGSTFVEWMHLDDEINDIVPPPRRGGRGQGQGQAQAQIQSAGEEANNAWEGTPGALDGIYSAIILPEFRATKDVRALEYWDAKLRHETEQMSQKKVAFDVDKFNQERRPALLWSRAQELVKIGLKNRAATDMFTLIKNYPSHPNILGWISELELLLTPPVPAPASASDTHAASP